jgi:hypothetical protein
MMLDREQERGWEALYLVAGLKSPRPTTGIVSNTLTPP